MEATVYQAEAEREETHWWFSGRRKLFANIIRARRLAPEDPILDVGTSTGTNLRMLKELGFENVTGLDMSEEAARFCAAKGFGTVRIGDVAKMPFSGGSFSLVLATDIIEHVDDDGAALAELHRVLRPGGMALITVPAFMSLWGFQDEVSHHKRRYRMGPLLERVREHRLNPRNAFYFNYLLFAPIWAARRLMRLTKPSIHSENELNTPLVNSLFGAIFRLDVATAGWLRPPFGVSILVAAEKQPPVAC